jgi:hypothetical protein
MEKENQGILGCLNANDSAPSGRGFSRHTGSIVRCTLFLLVTRARERSFNPAPALSNIGSMSPARLSLSTVASPHCRLLFHLARGILARKINAGCQGQPRTKRPSSLTVGWKSSYYSRLPVVREIFFLTFPFIEQAITLIIRFLSRRCTEAGKHLPLFP